MCQFASFCISDKFLDDNKVWLGDLHSHSHTVEAWSLTPEQYREVEWTGENKSTIDVRVPPNHHTSKKEYKAAIAARWASRSDFLAWALSEVAAGRHRGGKLHLTGCTSLTALPALPAVKTLYLRDCTSLTALPALPAVKTLYLIGCTSLAALPKFAKSVTVIR